VVLQGRVKTYQIIVPTTGLAAAHPEEHFSLFNYVCMCSIHQDMAVLRFFGFCALFMHVSGRTNYMENGDNLSMSSPKKELWDWNRHYVPLGIDSQDKRLTHYQFVLEVAPVLVHPFASSIAANHFLTSIGS